MNNTANSNSLQRPLAGLTVLDLTIALSGSYATLLLAGLGARVIKLENPLSPDSSRTNAPYLGPDGPSLIKRNDDDISVSALNRLRNKLGITLNLKHPGSREIYADLVRRADVVFENFSRGTLDRLGVGYDFVHTTNPRAVYCALTGFGSEGDGDTGTGKAFDTIIQAMSGAMYTSGEPDDAPVRAGVPIADMITPLFAVIGVLSALRIADNTGHGQFVDVSMLGSLTSLVAGEPFDVLERLGVPFRTGRTMPRLAPFGIYQAQDGFIAICAPTDAFANGLFDAMGMPELKSDPRFSSRDLRVSNVALVDEIVEDWTRTRPLANLLDALKRTGVPSAEVRDPHSSVRDPIVVDRNETVPLEHPRFGRVGDVYGTGVPIRFSDARTGLDQPAPELGQHNDYVYGELLGYSPGRIAELKEKGVI